MNKFETYLHNTGTNAWSDLTHRDLNALCAIWIEENRLDFEDAIWGTEPATTMADQAIVMFGGLKHSNIEIWRSAQGQIAELIRGAVIACAQRSAESWLRMRVDWLKEIRRHSVDEHDLQDLEVAS